MSKTDHNLTRLIRNGFSSNVLAWSVFATRLTFEAIPLFSLRLPARRGRRPYGPEGEKPHGLTMNMREVVEGFTEEVSIEKSVGIILVTHQDYIPERINARKLMIHNGIIREE